MLPPEIRNRPIIIHGLGVEGVATAQALDRAGVRKLILVDACPQHRDAFPRYLDCPYTIQDENTLQQNLAWLHTQNATYLRSPGIPPVHSCIVKAIQLGMTITTPTGLWLQHMAPANTVTITGTKGKSTTAKLVADILRWSGQSVSLLGNIGTPAFTVTPDADDICVLEASSYMMHDMPATNRFHAVINLYQEHLDWHLSFDAYANAKLRPVYDAPEKCLISQSILTNVPDALGGVQTIEQLIDATAEGLSLQGQLIRWEQLGVDGHSPATQLALQAACALCMFTGWINADRLAATLIAHFPTWQGLDCRQEIVPNVHSHHLWVCDTLATVPEATCLALTRWHAHPIRLIMGGTDRGQSFLPLFTQIEQMADIHIFAYGPVAQKIHDSAAPMRVHVDETLEGCIRAARRAAPADSVILFSPAASTCAPHKNYRERADIFRRMAQEDV